MKSVLESAKQKGYVCVYDHPDDPSSFCVGRVIGVDERHALLQCLDADGRDDGWTLKPIEQVYAVEEDTAYLSRLALLARRFEHSSPLEAEDGSMLEAMVRHVLKERACVSIELHESGVFDMQGYVVRADGGILHIRQLSDDGADNGVAHIRMDAITRADWGSDRERRLEFLSALQSAAES